MVSVNRYKDAKHANIRDCWLPQSCYRDRQGKVFQKEVTEGNIFFCCAQQRADVHLLYNASVLLQSLSDEKTV